MASGVPPGSDPTETSAPSVRLRVLGPLEVEGPDGRLDLGSSRHRAVLAALAVDAGHVVPAEVVAARVWGEEDAAASAGNLHALVSRLRGRLRAVTAAPVVVTQSSGYLLATDACEVDAIVVGRRMASARRMLAEGDVAGAHDSAADALGLWRGRPYADVPGDFAHLEADRLAEQRLACHELVAEAALALGRHEQLLDTLPTLVADHPLRESLHRALMLALYRAGRQADALAVYDRARRALAEELGIDPGPDLQRLWQRILRQDPALDDTVAPRAVAAGSVAVVPPPVPPTSAAPVAEPLVGRTDELARLVGLVDEAVAGRMTYGCVVGEPGIGKSRLVDALADQVAQRPEPALVVRGTCWDDEGTSPLWPWEQVLTALVELVGPDAARAATGAVPGATDALAVLVPALATEARGGTTWTTDDPDRARLRLFDAIARLLDVTSLERPVLVVLEDVHDADEESVALLRYLSRARRPGRVCVVATTRDVDGGPAVDVQASVGRSGGTVLPLRGLDEPDVATLVEHHLGSELRAGVAAALRERTDGNPFYLVELTRLLAQERSAGGRADVPVPRTVSAVVEGRLRGLPADDREVLGAAAVLGREVDLPLLQEVLGRPADVLAPALDRATAAGLLVDAGPGVQGFSHALVREVLEGSVGPVRRATWHAQVAAALVRRHGDAEQHAARVAHHHLSAGAVGDAGAAVRAAVRAADVAERRAAPGDAERLLRAALTAVPRLAPTVGEPLELDVRIRLAALLSRRLGYDHPDVAEHRSHALELARRCGSAEQLLAGLWGAWGSALVRGALGEADTLLADLEAAAARTREPWLEVAAAQAVGQVRLLQGRLGEAREHLERGIVLVDDLPPAPLDVLVQDPSAALRGWLTLTLTLLGAPEAAETARSARQVLDRIDHAYTTVYVELLLAWSAVWRADEAEARRAGDRALDVARSSGADQFAVFGLPPSAWALARSDASGATATALEQVGATVARYVEPGHHMFGTLVAAVHADLLLRAERPREALAVLERAVVTAREVGEVLVLPRLLELSAEASDALGRAEEAGASRHEARRTAAAQGARLWSA
ncbi:DNA-binding SARP family transcriptional activator [Nocardioides cavernae]|uniref:DNA-binding SARP family transcriptional activator n=1 Tax=Nocardioides cavernae TaxID=1921566 RepID=A0A7Y9H1X3_9ACTN|nr:BTAD domain-containing putative transcriptional regulator [Nocardioides cavernae]NYE36330.1 DNA-binding SARP family transcriptional activator [Nocardioides cavernae]